MFTLNRNIQQIFTPRFIGLAGVVIFFSVLFATLFGAPTNAAMSLDTAPSERATSYSYWKATSKCVRDHMRSTIRTVAGTDGATTPSQGGGGGAEGTTAGEWFDDLTAFVAVYPDGKLDCDDVMKKALTLWGWEYKQFLLDMGYTLNYDLPGYVRSNDTSTKRYEAFKDAVLKKVGNITGALFDGSAKYQLYLGSFTSTKTALSTCSGKKIGALASVDETIRNAANNNQARDGVTYTVIKLAEGSSLTDFVFTYKKNQSTDSSTGVTLTNHGSTWNYRGTPNDTGAEGERYKCEELVKMINANAGAYRAWAGAHTSNPDPQDPAGQVSGDADCSGEDCEAVTTCAIDGIGWLVCPVVNFLAGLADGAFQFIADNLLRTDVNILEQGGSTYNAWAVMRTIANVAFVIAFLLIIFSQMTGTGVSNYGVKKMLPRLIIAAILVNASFIICQLAVDISNILGYSISDALTGVGNGIIDSSKAENGVSPSATGTFFSDIAVAILAGGFALVALYALLSTFIPIILAAIIALVMILFLLVARQAIVVILIVLAPLAFVAFLLPNTQKLFTQWRKLFTAMLLLFPIIALVFGLSKLASGVIMTTFSGDVGDTEANSWFGQIIGAAILILPLFVVPSLLKKSLDGVPMVGQLANKWASRANGNLGKKLGEGYKNSAWGRGRAVRKHAKQVYRDRKFANNVVEGGAAGKIAALASGGVGVTKGQKYAQQSLERSAIAVNDKARTEDISTAAALMQEKHADPATQIDMVASDLVTAIKDGDITKARAAQSILLNSGGKGLDTLHDTLAEHMSTSARRNSDVGISLRNALNGAGLKGKDNALAAWAYTPDVDKNGKPVDASLAAVENSSGTYSGLTAAELGNQRMAVLERAIKANSQAITPGQARTILDSPEVVKDMDETKKAFFTDIMNGVNPTADGSSTQVLKSSLKAAQSGGGRSAVSQGAQTAGVAAGSTAASTAPVTARAATAAGAPGAATTQAPQQAGPQGPAPTQSTTQQAQTGGAATQATQPGTAPTGPQTASQGTAPAAPQTAAQSPDVISQPVTRPQENAPTVSEDGVLDLHPPQDSAPDEPDTATRAAETREDNSRDGDMR